MSSYECWTVVSMTLALIEQRGAESDSQGWHGWYFWRLAARYVRRPVSRGLGGWKFPRRKRLSLTNVRFQLADMASRTNLSHGGLCVCDTKPFFFGAHFVR